MRQLRIQYVEGINSNPVTLKSRLRVTQGHWKRNHWIDHTRLTISRVVWRWILSWPWNVGERSFKVIENGTIRRLWYGLLFASPSNYGGILYRRQDVCLILIKLEWIGYRVVKKLWQYVKPFKRFHRILERTEVLYQYRASVCWRAIKMSWKRSQQLFLFCFIWLVTVPKSSSVT